MWLAHHSEAGALLTAGSDPAGQPHCCHRPCHCHWGCLWPAGLRVHGPQPQNCQAAAPDHAGAPLSARRLLLVLGHFGLGNTSPTQEVLEQCRSRQHGRLLPSRLCLVDTTYLHALYAAGAWHHARHQLQPAKSIAASSPGRPPPVSQHVTRSAGGRGAGGGAWPSPASWRACSSR